MQETFWLHRENKRRKLASRYGEAVRFYSLFEPWKTHQQITFFGTKVGSDYRLLTRSSKYYAVTVAFFANEETTFPALYLVPPTKISLYSNIT